MFDLFTNFEPLQFILKLLGSIGTGVIAIPIYSYFVKTRQKKINKTKKNRRTLIDKLKSDNDAMVSFFFNEIRVRSKCMLFSISFMISMFAMLVFMAAMMSSDFRTSLEPSDRNFLIYIIIACYIVVVTSAALAMKYKIILIRIKSIFDELIKSKDVFDPNKYI